jgi:hypothetical protein
VTILSLWWWAITAIGVVCILGVSSRYGDTARAQNNADAVALAYLSTDLASAQKLADALHVTIESVTTNGLVVTITIRSGSLIATAQASP